MSHQFAFKMRYTARPTDHYYVTNWERGSVITVVATTRQEAFDAAATALGNAPEHCYWVFRVLEITDARLTGGEQHG